MKLHLPWHINGLQVVFMVLWSVLMIYLVVALFGLMVYDFTVR